MLQASHQSWPTVWSTEAEVDLQNRLSKLPFYAPNGFGGVAEDIQSILAKGPELLSQAVAILNQAGPHLATIMQAVQDPAFPQLVDRIKALKAVEDAKASTTPKVAAAPGTAPASTDTGIGKLLPLFDAAIFIEKRPVMQFMVNHPVLVGASAFLVITGIGFGVGRLTKRCRASSSGVGHRYRRR